MKKVLVVDDEKDIRDLIKDKLSANKYAVITAGNGEEALIVARNNKPDLILLDIAMPGIDGYTTCEKLKNEPVTKNIPILFLTGKDLDLSGIQQRCSNLGANGYVSKMATLKELIEDIKKVI